MKLINKEGKVLVRILTSLVGIPLAIALIIWPGGQPFNIAICLLVVLAILEMLLMFARSGNGLSLRPNLIAAALGAVFVAFCWRDPLGLINTWFGTAFTIGLISAFVWEFPAAIRREPGGAVRNVAFGLFTGLYVGFFYFFLIQLRGDPTWSGQISLIPDRLIDKGAAIVLLLFVTVWAGDTAAYFIGTRYGKRKLAPAISPNKTVEGALANLLACTIVGSLMANWIGISWDHGLALGMTIGIFGQIGDLFESLIKREAGVKDSGQLFPGHGGVLDRFDAVMIAAPLVYYYLIWTHALAQ